MTSKTPPSLTAPTSDSAKKTEPAFGWNAYAEKTNGRFAMVGFVALVLLEFFTRENFFTWLGLR
jgi:hypothetical protein